MEKKFNPEKLHKLNNPERLSYLPPDTIWEQINLPDARVMLDIGAGTGFYSIPFAAFMNKGKVYACDISSIMLDWIKENVIPAHPAIIPVLMKENHVPLEDHLADIIVMINLHHELDKPVKMLKECYRLLQTGGKIAIIDWKKEKMPIGPPFEIRCTTEEVKQQLRESAFSNIKIIDVFSKNLMLIAEKGR